MSLARQRAVLAALALALAPGAAAQAPPLQGRRLLVEVGVRQTAFDYAEYGRTGAFLDGETGFVPSLDGALEVRGEGLTLRGVASLGGASLGYAGHVQSGSVQLNGLPFVSTSGAHLVAAGAEVSFAVPRLRGVALLAGAARRRWDRSIHDGTVVSRAGTTAPVRGLVEAYRWDVLHAGVRVPLLAAPRLAWDAEARLTRTLRPELTVALPGGDVRLPLGARTGYAAGTTLRVAFGPVLVARLGVSLERWAFGASDVDPRTLASEPRSTTRTLSYEAGLGARF